MKQIVNFKQNKKTAEGWIKVIPLIDREVFIEAPICLVDFGVEYEEPVLAGELYGLPLVQEAETVRKKIAEQNKSEKLRTYHLAVKDHAVTEVPKDEAQWSGELPENTDLSQLEIGQNNELIKNVKIKEE